MVSLAGQANLEAMILAPVILVVVIQAPVMVAAAGASDFICIGLPSPVRILLGDLSDLRGDPISRNKANSDIFPFILQETHQCYIIAELREETAFCQSEI